MRWGTRWVRGLPPTTVTAPGMRTVQIGYGPYLSGTEAQPKVPAVLTIAATGSAFPEREIEVESNDQPVTIRYRWLTPGSYVVGGYVRRPGLCYTPWQSLGEVSI